MRIDRLMIMAAAFAATGSMAQAAICDYRPSHLLGGYGTGTVAAGVAATGTIMKAAGFYTLVNATTGATMLGSVAAGASGAGTVGIIGGTAGFIGTVASILMAPATIAAASVTAVVVGGYENACYYLVDERITDYAEIDAIMQDLGQQADPEYFQYREANNAAENNALIWVKNDKGERDEYEVRNLYIINGELRHSDWFFDTMIGQVGVRSDDVRAFPAEAE